MSVLDHHKFKVRVVIPWMLLYIGGAILFTIAFAFLILGF